MELDAVLRERRSMRKYQPDRKVSREQVDVGPITRISVFGILR